MTVLVFGHSGQVATELRRLAAQRTPPVPVVALGRARADLMEPGACAAAIRAHAPCAVINAAAYTGVDRAEAEAPQAIRLNAEAPAVMARACAARDIPFVHISTDYVFDGAGHAPFAPGDPTAPLGVYGRSKRAGEVAVQEIMDTARKTGAGPGRYAILRSSWVFSAHGANFVKTMLRLSEQRDHIRVVADQIGGPTPARAIAAACLDIAGHLARDPSAAGLYHFSGTPEVSWAGFARAIFAAAGRQVTVEDIPSAAYPTPAARPLNSRLDCSRTTQVFGLSRPEWRRDLTPLLAELDLPTGALT
ncbi:dTDP-4-dehydrorhamnose reductase (plasmid) [Pacificitalea manganoxidans]|uniref:dTDP-4-dehydrorhamnose reductase n=1 Tax=Pacificitalea manganoxidans TaxID=1411902 RepID=A0A291M4Y2_9RHOB|nr:dTDP-4-dehydrorhamnose reductase [Pacificitalea manganoxidans]ATI43964.1 dTDP-4-dehydrorhamnose reductase [Pacificitalea manganoxidans]MDR6310357.1 dTDP-4-dehydrorhamnose reductase [Pacificitalea manganoxidans]